MTTTLYYVHDPMCSWCWAFRPVWQSVKSRLPANLPVHNLLGGLAPDTNLPMAEDMRQFLQQTWQKIQTTVPGTAFNFDFWSETVPRRSTYPACRAVIAARSQDKTLEEAMILSIQEAYYLHAINPSIDESLIALAEKLGLDNKQFKHDLNAEQTQQNLLKEIHFHQALGARGFPGLVLKSENNTRIITSSYTDADYTLDNILDNL